VRYVGKAIDPYARYRRHLKAPHSKGLSRWIDELAGFGSKPRLRVLLGRTECEWIDVLHPDLNVAEGDDSASNEMRVRFNVDVAKEKARWKRAAAKLHMKLTVFVKLAVEEKIRKDGLD
jgi:hypothetical protein